MPRGSIARVLLSERFEHGERSWIARQDMWVLASSTSSYVNANDDQKPNVIRLKESLPLQSCPVLVMELLPKGNISAMFPKNGHRVPPQNAPSVMKQSLSALEYLHKLGIVHTTSSWTICWSLQSNHYASN